MPTLTFTNGDDQFVAVSTWDSSDPLVLHFLAGNDSLRTTFGITRAFMGDGNDFARVDTGSSGTIFGEAGNDRIDIYASRTSAEGGAGNDVFNLFGTVLTSLRVLGGDGDDRVNFRADVPWNIDNSRLSSSIHGGDGNDLFVGYGHDVGRVFGGEGNDRFYDFGRGIAHGGLGDDIFRIRPGGSTAIFENPGEGMDTVQVAYGASFTLPANVENLAAVDFANAGNTAVLTGNDLNNRIVGGNLGESLFGKDGSDSLSGKAGADKLDGGPGNDSIEGGSGRDQLEGGSGADRFTFRDGDFGGATIGSADVVHDFSRSQGDRIRLDPVDANSGVAGNQAFAFIGSAAFNGTAGQLRYQQIDGHTFIQGDVNGDGAADFMIRVNGLHVFAGSDFIL